ncbi:MAG: HAD family hydrolase [Nanobdellota archaeon]
MTKKAVLFDLDGTLVNSIPFHYSIHKTTMKQRGIDLSEEFFEMECNGASPTEFYATIFQHYKGNTRGYKTALGEYKKIRKQQDLSTIKTFPGVKTVLKQLQKAGYKIIIATSSTHQYAKTVLKRNNIIQYVDDIVGSNEVARSKPHPDIFLMARKKSGIKKAECVVVEDAVNGVKAAKRAGIDCLCMLTSEKRKDIPDYATVVKKHSQLFDVIENI